MVPPPPSLIFPLFLPLVPHFFLHFQQEMRPVLTLIPFPGDRFENNFEGSWGHIFFNVKFEKRINDYLEAH